MNSLEEKIKEQEAKLARLAGSMIDYGEQVEKLKEAAKGKQKLYDEAALELNGLFDKISKAEDSLKQLNDGISEKHDTFLGLDQERETATGEYLKVLEGHKEDIKKKKDEVYKLILEIDELNSEFDGTTEALNKEKDNLISSNSALNNKIKEGEITLEDVKERISAFSSERANLIERIGNLQNTKDGLDQVISGLKDSQSPLKQTNEELIQENERLSLAIEAIDSELIKTKEEIAAEESRLDEKRIENKKESDKLVAVRTSLDNTALKIKYDGLRVQKLIKKHRLEDEIKKMSE